MDARSTVLRLAAPLCDPASADKLAVLCAQLPSALSCPATSRIQRPFDSQVTVASVEDSLTVTCSRQVKIVADKSIADCAGESFDLIALPVSKACLLALACSLREMAMRISRHMRVCTVVAALSSWTTQLQLPAPVPLSGGHARRRAPA